MKHSGHPTVIYHAASTQQAALLKNLLEDRGIAAWIDNDMIQSAAGELPLGWRGSARVIVQEKDAEEARQFVVEFDARSHDGPTPDPLEDPPYEPEAWDNWPQCPVCGELRHTRCPLCNTGGTAFPLVDLEETDHGERVLLLCENCDEHFRPAFFRLCHRCGHDFGSGMRTETQARVLDAPAGESSRTWLVAAVLGGIALAILGYFMWLLGR